MTTDLALRIKSDEIELPKFKLPTDVESWTDRKLDSQIKRGHQQTGAHLNGFVAAAITTGVLLREKKRRVKSFSKWVEESFDGSRATAYRYLDFADKYVPNSLTDETTPALPAGDEEADEEPVIEAEVEAVTEEVVQVHQDAEVVPVASTETVEPVSFEEHVRQLKADVEALADDELDVFEQELRALVALVDVFEQELRALVALVEERKAKVEQQPEAEVETSPAGVKITGLSALNVRAIEECFEEQIQAGLIVCTKTTAEFSYSPAVAAELIAKKIGSLSGKSHPKASLHAVQRRLAKVA